MRKWWPGETLKPRTHSSRGLPYLPLLILQNCLLTTIFFKAYTWYLLSLSLQSCSINTVDIVRWAWQGMASQVSRYIWGLALFCFHYQQYVVEPVRLTPKDIFRILGLCSSSPSRIAGSININIVTPASLVAHRLWYWFSLSQWTIGINAKKAISQAKASDPWLAQQLWRMVKAPERSRTWCKHETLSLLIDLSSEPHNNLSRSTSIKSLILDDYSATVTFTIRSTNKAIAELNSFSRLQNSQTLRIRLATIKSARCRKNLYGRLHKVFLLVKKVCHELAKLTRKCRQKCAPFRRNIWYQLRSIMLPRREAG